MLQRQYSRQTDNSEVSIIQLEDYFQSLFKDPIMTTLSIPQASTSCSHSKLRPIGSDDGTVKTWAPIERRGAPPALKTYEASSMRK